MIVGNRMLPCLIDRTTYLTWDWTNLEHTVLYWSQTYRNIFAIAKEIVIVLVFKRKWFIKNNHLKGTPVSCQAPCRSLYPLRETCSFSVLQTLTSSNILDCQDSATEEEATNAEAS